jgi:hypothetical protein
VRGLRPIKSYMREIESPISSVLFCFFFWTKQGLVEVETVVDFDCRPFTYRK